MALTFLTAACIVLCFAFVTRTVLTTHQCLAIAGRCLHCIKAFSPTAPLPPTTSRLGVGKIWEGAEPGQLVPNDQRDSLYHVMLCSAIKAGEKEKKGDICGYSAGLPKQPPCVLRPCFPGSRWTSAC